MKIVIIIKKMLKRHNAGAGFELRDEGKVRGEIRTKSLQFYLQQALHIIPGKTAILPQKLKQAT